MTKFGKSLIKSAKQARAIACGEADPATYRVHGPAELDEDQWLAFNESLDNPPLPNEQLKQLMARKAPWEK